LPPGPAESRALQTARWLVPPIAFLGSCGGRFGDSFSVRFLGSQTPLVMVSDPDAIRAMYSGREHCLLPGRTFALRPVIGGRGQWCCWRAPSTSRDTGDAAHVPRRADARLRGHRLRDRRRAGSGDRAPMCRSGGQRQGGHPLHAPVARCAATAVMMMGVSRSVARLVNPIPAEEIPAWVRAAATTFLQDPDGPQAARWIDLLRCAGCLATRARW
jgi:hypothetical protein